ncbi:MAG: D-alanyl-D-alanine carboxypeptidase [Ruminococcus sp.]|nr:D-alanyl-D-alanine carboxypeptidase [Ruminococcus sp.]
MKKMICLILSAVMLLSGVTVMDMKVSAKELTVSAKSAIVIDKLTGKVLYEHNAYEKLPMASTTKIMSALLTAESGGIDKRFTVDKDAIKVEGSSIGLVPGDKVTKRILIYGMLLPSGNDAANAAAVSVSGSVQKFVQLMNDKAKALGLSDTHFVTPSGLDDDTDEHYSTSYDMARLASFALDNGIFREICGVSSAKLSFGDPPYDRWLVNTNKLLSSLDGVIGVKTGFTDKAGRCLVSACERNGTTLICVTLNDRNDWADHKAMYEHCFEKCSETKLEYKNDITVPVVGGVSDYAGCYSPEVRISLPVGEKSKVTAELCIKPFVYAPVLQKEKTGEVRYYYKGKQIASSPVFTKLSTAARLSGDNSVLKSIFDRIKRLLT